MFNQFGATAETLSKASAVVLRIGTDAHLYDDPEDVSIAPLLDSKFDSEKCEALKRVLALIAQGFDVSNFFPQVVKNVASQSLEVKKLVYLYLLHYAEKRPNEALLSINYFQKDLGDPNPLVRAWALRTMAGIRLHIIAPLVLAAVGKCARDPAVYVRKCAANALPKLHDLQLEEHAPAIEELVGILLNDHSPGVVGAAAAAFSSVCPNNFELIRRNYRKLCEILPDVEEWGQIVLIGILLRYAVARHGLVRESLMLSPHSLGNGFCKKDGLGKELVMDKGDGDMNGSLDSDLVGMVIKCYVEGPDDYLSRSSCHDTVSSAFGRKDSTSIADNDGVKILLQCTSPLLWSNNSAVVLAAAGVHWIMGPKEDVKKIVKPLLFLLRSSSSSKYVVLCNILVFAKAVPSLFAPHFEYFYISSSDAYQVKALKLEILSLVATSSSISSIFREFEDYIGDPDRQFAADTVAAIGVCAKRLPNIPTSSLDGLLALIGQESFAGNIESMDGEAAVLVQAVMSVQTIIEQDPLSHEKVIIQLFRSLDSIKVPAARSTIIWMVGVYSSLGHIIPKMMTTVIKYLAWSFKSEASDTKLQILNTTAKVLTSAKGEDFLTLKRIVSYVLELGECDLNYDVRDRTRFLRKLLSDKLASHERGGDDAEPQENFTAYVAEHVFGRKLGPFSPKPSHHRFYLPGSLSHIVLHAAPGYEPLPKPCSFVFEEHDQLSDLRRQRDVATDSDGSRGSSGTIDDYGSESATDSVPSSDSDESTPSNEARDTPYPLIQISDFTESSTNQGGGSVSNSADLEELRSRKALDMWLNEQPSTSTENSSVSTRNQSSYAKISIGDIGSRVKPKTYTLLDPANGNGLKVDYAFLSEVSTVSMLHVCVEIVFENSSSEPILEVNLEEEETNKASDSVDQALVEKGSISQDNVPTLVPMEEINRLDPGERAKGIIQVRFHHHLLPLKLALRYNGKKVPVKLRPDIGYFVKPFSMSVEAFKDTESRLPGMFEYTRRCTFTGHVGDESTEAKDRFLWICESIGLKMLSNSNLFLVSVEMPVANNLEDATGLCLRFGSKILSSEIPLLISVTVEGRCSEPLNLTIKINCEETVFGLNLLNRVANFLADP
ncbi:PREDICTED: AP3-complex subunit beta-A [Tarenaya hassleriana]|uniref:AP3-complex subunit beta-A n=1 Tax=Tarenaya hassleriana TaxID=28532 RepID=UPI00053C8632|nr:PREDICTED: AP3-complex subunit beta-A [Tarenaya hassleriana]